MKKRILSLILALSMMLSVLPLGAFAAAPQNSSWRTVGRTVRTAPLATAGRT